ncbi:hypothetical protein BD410DRAFT_364756 [Rickenella mellea]|uniref:Uncharacterized protein n=1 Tax=Rickenella mellea TaxID=50990 RepID=A0A4Y7PZC1_9AGAM|nr:hypothetical protein BD410DRAFT_364756 [Rickenella mellea]
MDVHDYYCQPNSSLSLRLAEGDITVTVVQAFTPFTRAQVLVVRTHQTSPIACLPSKSLVVLKIYDPRFFDHRKATKYRPAHLWSFQAESEAAKKPRASPTAFLEHSELPEDDDPVQWEEYYYKYFEKRFQAETASYEALKSLQGTAIPKYFAAGRLTITERLAPRAISPRVILIEYIPNAKNLNDVDAKLITPPWSIR